MKGVLRAFGVFVVLAAAALPACAGTFCVSPVGDDAAAGSAEAPWKTIQRGVKALSAGDTLVVMPGEYNETVNISELKGTEEKPVTISGKPGALLVAAGRDGVMIYESAWIVVEGLEITGANGKAGLRIANSNHITVSSCNFSENKPWSIKTGMSDYVTVQKCKMDGKGAAICIYFSTTDHPVLSGCELHGAQMGLHVNGDLGEGGDGMISHARFVGNTIHNITKTCISLDGVEHGLVANNLLYNNTGKGIVSFKGNGRETGGFNVFANNTVYFRPDEGRYAFRVIGGGHDNTVVNNIFINSSRLEAALAMESDSLEGFTCNNNILFGRAGKGAVGIGDDLIALADWQGRGFDAASIEADPADIFVDAEGGDFNLKAGSPAINAGVAVDGVSADIEGLARLAGGAVDIGCYEFQEQAQGKE